MFHQPIDYLFSESDDDMASVASELHNVNEDVSSSSFDESSDEEQCDGGDRRRYEL